jgi:hypothetical protein
VSKNRVSPSGSNGHAATPPPGSGYAAELDEAVEFDSAVDFENGEQNEQKEMPAADAFQLLLRQFHELNEYFAYYLSAKADRARLGLRNAIVNMTLAALAFVVVASLAVAAIWFVLSGTADGLGVLFGNRPWAGSLLTGLVLVAGICVGLCRIVIRFKKTAREGTVAKYENRQSQQQVRYGHNVSDRAAAHGSEQK